MSDLINHPDHYMVGGFEAIDVIASKMDLIEYRGYLRGNVMKYVMRCKYKDQEEQDLKKALWYLSRLVSTYEVKNESPAV